MEQPPAETVFLQAAAEQPPAEKKPRKKPRRGGIGGRPIRRPPKPVHADQRPLAERRAAYKAAGGETDKKCAKELHKIIPRAIDRLQQLWFDTYEIPVKLELAENDFLGLTESALQLQSAAPMSTYQMQGRVTEDQALRREIADGLMRIKWAAAARHRNNQRDCPFSMLARSIGKLARVDSGKTWVEDKSILSKVRSRYYLQEMLPLRPPPPFRVAIQVSAYAWDQFYMKEHCEGKNGEYRGRKSVSTTGFSHSWNKITNINTVEVRRAFEPTHPLHTHVRALIVRSPVLLVRADSGACYCLHADRVAAQGDHRGRAVHGAAVGRLPDATVVAGAHRPIARGSTPAAHL